MVNPRAHGVRSNIKYSCLSSKITKFTFSHGFQGKSQRGLRRPSQEWCQGREYPWFYLFLSYVLQPNVTVTIDDEIFVAVSAGELDPVKVCIHNHCSSFFISNCRRSCLEKLKRRVTSCSCRNWQLCWRTQMQEPRCKISRVSSCVTVT